MDLSDLIIERILELQKQNKMNTYQLSLKSGIPRSTLSKLLSRQSKTIRLENLLYICEAFNIKLWQFFFMILVLMRLRQVNGERKKLTKLQYRHYNRIM